MKSARTLAALLVALAALAVVPISAAQEPSEFVRPVDGSLVLAGSGPLPDCVVDVFLHLAGDPGAQVLVVRGKGKPKTLERWTKRGARSATALGPGKMKDRDLALAMLDANAVWFEDGAQSLRKNKLFASLLRGLLRRGGVVGGADEGALAIVGASFGLLPGCAVELVTGSASKASTKDTTLLKGGDGLVGWQIPNGNALVVHGGRRVCAYGTDHVVVRVAGQGAWAERKRMIQAIDVFDATDRPSYEIDLLSWIRSAKDRQGPVFPSEKPGRPTLPKGTLVLSGGGKVGADTWKRFIDGAGGKDARFVCIPSANDFTRYEEIDSYSARKLRDAGCDNVDVLHVVDPIEADSGPRLLALLEKADGVWIDGGRTYRFMDAFQGTKAQALMQQVLERGGAVGGSSAGCQVAGGFLLRGNPRTNRTLLHEGYTRGLGLLEGVILDAHFSQRKRGPALRELVANNPGFLGIGVDEDTALVIHGSKAEVVGPHKVIFYDASRDQDEVYELEAGQSFDLLKRKRLK